MKPKIAAIVPMRADSKRVPGKNWRLLGGRPLFAHIVAALENCGWIDEIVIDTDSDTIRRIVHSEFANVTLIDRPEHLRDDKLPMNDVLLNTVSRIDADLFLQTHSTNPLLRPETIADAVQSFIALQDRHDSLFGVTRLQQRLWDELTRPVNHNPDMLLRTQDLPPMYVENSCMYLFSRELLTKRRNRIGARPLMFEIERTEAWDIDEETDFTIAEMLYQAIQHRRTAA